MGKTKVEWLRDAKACLQSAENNNNNGRREKNTNGGKQPITAGNAEGQAKTAAIQGKGASESRELKA